MIRDPVIPLTIQGLTAVYRVASGTMDGSHKK